jgi:hypothetical protein
MELQAIKTSLKGATAGVASVIAIDYLDNDKNGLLTHSTPKFMIYLNRVSD